MGWFSGTSRAAEIHVGDKAPDFSAPASDGTMFHLADKLGKGPIVLYFYPKDDTPGCTKEACGIRDSFSEFRGLNAQVYGVSYDDAASHKRFIEKHQLPFVLLSDTDKTIAKAYGADGLLTPKRQTFIIAQDGTLAWLKRSVDPTTHAKELRDAMGQLKPAVTH